MESPTLSRSSSFAPGPHRRSHPNLHHLSLAPLTPKYPIDPADYTAYFDPSTSELHTSASISQIASLPSPGGILSHSAAHSRANSRASSRTRLKRKTKSTVSIQEAATKSGLVTPSGALTGQGFGHKSQRLQIQTDPSWLIQTGLTLTEGSRESKGQSWIFKRDSSTSLHTPSADDRLPYFSRSGRATPTVSRRSSRRRSRRSLAMTPALATPMDESGPDWADAHTHAEIAAQVANDLAEEFENDDADDDPYGVLDFEAHFDSDDEEDVRQEISKYRLGGWMDGIVDAFLRLEEFPDAHDHPPDMDLETRNVEPERPSAPLDTVPANPRTTAGPDNLVEPPLERPNGVWDDVVWFGRLIARTMGS